jgi:hypothetical protein
LGADVLMTSHRLFVDPGSGAAGCAVASSKALERKPCPFRHAAGERPRAPKARPAEAGTNEPEERALTSKRHFFFSFASGAPLLLILFVAALAFGQQPQAPTTPPTAPPATMSGPTIPSLPGPRPGYSFPVKQTLNYAVDWRVFPAATAVLHLEADGNRERLTADAETVSAINLIFHVSDKFQSTFDRDKGCTAEFDKQTIEGRRQINSTLKLDYAQGKSILDERNLTNGQTKHLEAGIPGCLTDLLTGVFYASSQPMEVGKSFDMPVVDPLKTVVVTMKVEAREELKTPAGTFKTIRVEPTAEAGVVKNRGQIWIWYSDDDRHLPVQMRARSFWGTITFRLSSVENK